MYMCVCVCVEILTRTFKAGTIHPPFLDPNNHETQRDGDKSGDKWEGERDGRKVAENRR